MTIAFAELAAIRLGYGFSPHGVGAANAADLVDSVRLSEAPDGLSSTDFFRQNFLRLQSLNKLRRAGDKTAEQARRELRRSLGAMRWHDLLSRVARGVGARDGFGERLAQFWADHFSIRADDNAQQPLVSAYLDEAIRPHLSGTFADMLIAVVSHPMMLLYLNQNRSVGPNSMRGRRLKRGLNENLAREILELHTVGVAGSYTQRDVRQLAELLTGMAFTYRRGAFFDRSIAEPGAETILGREYGDERRSRLAPVHAFLRDIAVHPDTAAHLARKLAVHFVADDPPADLVAELAAVWRESEGNLRDVYHVLAAHPALATRFRAKLRQPLDYMITGLRALGIRGEDLLAVEPRLVNPLLLIPLSRMGQPWGRPNGPDGWPETAEAWISPNLLAARIEWAQKAPQLLKLPVSEPKSFLKQALGNTASADLLWAAPRAESKSDAMTIVLASGDFNRR